MSEKISYSQLYHETEEFLGKITAVKNTIYSKKFTRNLQSSYSFSPAKVRTIVAIYYLFYLVIFVGILFVLFIPVGNMRIDGKLIGDYQYGQMVATILLATFGYVLLRYGAHPFLMWLLLKNKIVLKK